MRSDTPAASVDILDALLSAPAAPESGDAFPGLESLERLIRRVAMPPAAKKSEPAAPRPKATPTPLAVVPRSAPKRKVTHYIEEVTRARLDRARDALAALTAPIIGDAEPRSKKVRITKSGLVEAALALALDGFEAAGPQSPLARRLRTTKGSASAPSSRK